MQSPNLIDYKLYNTNYGESFKPTTRGIFTYKDNFYSPDLDSKIIKLIAEADNFSMQESFKMLTNMKQTNKAGYQRVNDQIFALLINKKFPALHRFIVSNQGIPDPIFNFGPKTDD